MPAIRHFNPCQGGASTSVLGSTWFLLPLLLLLMAHPASAETTASATGEEYSSGGTAQCLTCHDRNSEKPSHAILSTRHGMSGDSRTPMSQDHGCETCHGPSKAHTLPVREGERRPPPPMAFKAERDGGAPAENQSGVCLGCHEKQHVNWKTSIHAAGGLTCTSCHTIHSLNDPVRQKKDQAEVCLTCHLAKRVEINKPFRHPIREGEVTCTGCHNPHGSAGPSQLVKHSVNETCYQCHAEKRGPFLMEHEPVQEDCTYCHEPHGSVNERMLHTRQPFLCQQCHVFSRHPGTLYDTGRLNPPSNRMIGSGCTNCHSQIHGSNHPAGPTFRR